MYGMNQEDKQDLMTQAMVDGGVQNGSPTFIQAAQEAARRQRAKELAQYDTAEQVAQEAAGMLPQEQQQPLQPFYNQDLANQVLSNVIQNNVVNAIQQQPVQQEAVQSPELSSGLLLSDGVRAALANNTQPQQTAAPQAPATLTQMARQYANQIIEAKQTYQAAKEIGGDNGEQAMKLAHQGAEQARARLQQLGVNPAAYGLDDELSKAQEGLAANDTRALQNVLEGDMSESSGAYYDRMYQLLRDRGFSRDVAERGARRRAEEYANKRVRVLGNVFNMYGRNDTTINPLGVQLLNMMADEDTEKAGAYLKQYAGPRDEYAYAKQRGLAEQQQSFTERNLSIKQKDALEQMATQAQYTVLFKRIDAGIDKAKREEDFEHAKQLETFKAQLSAYLGGSGTSRRGSGKSNANGSDDMTTSEAIAKVKQYEAWNKENTGVDEKGQEKKGQEWENPYADAYDAALKTLNNHKNVPDDVNDARSVYRWAQEVLEDNARQGFHYTPDALYQMIAAVGGYGKAVADALRSEGALMDYGANTGGAEIRNPR